MIQILDCYIAYSQGKLWFIESICVIGRLVFADLVTNYICS